MRITTNTEKQPITEHQKNFVIELTNLTKKYGISICGCGCCGSPWLDMEADVSSGAGYRLSIGSSDGELRWVAPSDAYDWEHFSEEIVKCE